MFYNKIYILKNKILKYNLTRNRRALTGRVKQTGSLLRWCPSSNFSSVHSSVLLNVYYYSLSCTKNFMVPPYDKMSSSNQNPYFWVKGVGYGKKGGVFQTTRSGLTIDTGCRLADRWGVSPPCLLDSSAYIRKNSGWTLGLLFDKHRTYWTIQS